MFGAEDGLYCEITSFIIIKKRKVHPLAGVPLSDAHKLLLRMRLQLALSIFDTLFTLDHT